MKKAYPLKQDDINVVHEVSADSNMRLNKYLTVAGYCSRREADRLIEQGRVSVDGEIAGLGVQVALHQAIKVDDTLVTLSQNHVYILLNKPVGVTCTLEEDVEGNLVDFMNFKQRIFPVGRLDKDSSGLLLLTSDGDIVNRILRAENDHDKEYIVQVNRDITSDFLKKMGAGVEITNMKTKQRVKTKPCKVTRVDQRQFKIVLTQGLNRQIRRMCSELGYRVTALKRIRIMNLNLEPLKVGQYRYLNEDEMKTLKKTIAGN